MMEYKQVTGKSVKLNPDEVKDLYCFLAGDENENGQKIYDKIRTSLKQAEEEEIKKIIANSIFGRGDHGDE